MIFSRAPATVSEIHDFSRHRIGIARSAQFLATRAHLRRSSSSGSEKELSIRSRGSGTWSASCMGYWRRMKDEGRSDGRQICHDIELNPTLSQSHWVIMCKQFYCRDRTLKGGLGSWLCTVKPPETKWVKHVLQYGRRRSR